MDLKRWSESDPVFGLVLVSGSVFGSKRALKWSPEATKTRPKNNSENQRFSDAFCGSKWTSKSRAGPPETPVEKQHYFRTILKTLQGF